MAAFCIFYLDTRLQKGLIWNLDTASQMEVFAAISSQRERKYLQRTTSRELECSNPVRGNIWKGIARFPSFAGTG